MVLCTSGPGGLSEEEEQQLGQAGIEVREDRVVCLEGGDGLLDRVVFAEGDPLSRRALFFCSGQHQRSHFAAALGVTFNAKGTVDTGSCEVTNVPGLYVAGDASKNAQFVIVAAAEGTEAAMAINKITAEGRPRSEEELHPSRTSRGGPYAKRG